MEKLQEALKELECPVCLEYMVEEIALCKGGHSVCKKCKDELPNTNCPLCKQIFVSDRNYTLEKLASTYTYNCRNNGCEEKLEAIDINKHEKNCEHSLYPCPLYFTNCAWTGKTTESKKHIEGKHQEYIDNWKGYQNLYFYTIIYNDYIFLIFCKYVEKTQVYSAVYFGTNKEAGDFLLTVNYSDQTGKGYELSATNPCVPRCKIENVFDGENIVFCERHMSLQYFINKNNSYVINVKIRERGA